MYKQQQTISKKGAWLGVTWISSRTFLPDWRRRQQSFCTVRCMTDACQQNNTRAKHVTRVVASRTERYMCSPHGGVDHAPTLVTFPEFKIVRSRREPKQWKVCQRAYMNREKKRRKKERVRNTKTFGERKLIEEREREIERYIHTYRYASSVC